VFRQVVVQLKAGKKQNKGSRKDKSTNKCKSDADKDNEVPG
jgi:hypothetical protein